MNIFSTLMLYQDISPRELANLYNYSPGLYWSSQWTPAIFCACTDWPVNNLRLAMCYFVAASLPRLPPPLNSTIDCGRTSKIPLNQNTLSPPPPYRLCIAGPVQSRLTRNTISPPPPYRLCIAGPDPLSPLYIYYGNNQWKVDKLSAWSKTRELGKE
jgi:hypothetical protein